MGEGYLKWNVTVRAFDPAVPPPPPVPGLYMLSESCFSYGGKNYAGSAPPGTRYFNVSDNLLWPSGSIWTISNILNNIDCGLYSIGGAVFYTVFYEHGYKAIAEILLAGYGAVCDTYSEGLFVPTAGIYAYQGNPGGWAVLGGSVDPPTLTVVP